MLYVYDQYRIYGCMENNLINLCNSCVNSKRKGKWSNNSDRDFMLSLKNNHYILPMRTLL